MKTGLFTMGCNAQLRWLFLVSLSSIICIHGQLDNLGFISIDCGYTASPDYTDSKTGLTYVSDASFINAGLIHTVDPSKMQQADLAHQYSTVRFFPNGTRNCYTLQSLTLGGKYLVRAAFGYGDYDTLNRPPTFDLYFGVNYWTTVTIVNTSTAYLYEIIAVAPAKFLHICLVDRGSGTPFISVLELRSLVPTLYPVVSLAQSLVLLSFFRDTVKFGFNRYHFGTDDQNIRYPDDPYDRMWQKYEDVPNWIDVPNKTDGVVQNAPNDHYSPPSAVMRSASSPLNASRMHMSWSSDSSLTLDVGSNYFLVLYFTELEEIQVGFREFHVSVDNYSLADAFSPIFFRASVLSWTVPRSSHYVVSLIATPNSTLGPVISGMEIYMLRQQNESTTYSADANAMMTIQMKFSVKKNWVGDPCSPVFFAWDGLECRYAPSSPPRITALNLSSSGLAAEVDISVGQLKLLQYLDLSHNKLSGSIPEFLGELTSLKYLDLSNNNFSGPIPGALLEKSQNGLLVLRQCFFCNNNPNLCGNYTCNKKKNKITGVIEIIVPVISSIALLSVVLLVRWHRIKKRQDVARPVNPFEKRNFKYNELRLITDNFNKVIGTGGFGPVYFGSLENGTPVAVKVRSETSSQGHKEFLAEVRYLARVHHKNLVSLIGYCKDKKHLSLVYEYMDGGNLEDRLKAQVPLNWLQRLNIALDCAYGLHYLHKSCGRPLIHRDVKAVKILLTADLEAKISDFGLTRAFSSEMTTHATTRPMGTSGYLDPEYYATSHLSEKSDVYSFGILLLVLITAQPVIVAANNAKSENIALWVRSRLLEGDIESLTDLRIRGHYDVNSVWKVAEMALHCMEHKRQDRPTMMEVVEGLKEALQLENSSRSSVETGRQFAVC